MWTLATLFGWLAGCDPRIAEEPDVLPAGGCQEGLSPTTNAYFAASRFRIDDDEYPVTFDPEFEFGGLPAACVDPAGTTF